ncbi:MAG: glutathione synthase/RimK-type ligase-like ATP-grasp enzyme [Cognaticolwellia sp.]|jgi:glutathione synthase/RimK-type ligase-like ATP-grasp enzyme
MDIALATCSALPEWEKDDLPLHTALRALGVVIHQPVWDDAEVDWTRFDAVLIRTTWDYAENREAFVAWARKVGDRLLNPPRVVVWNTHKSYLRALAKEKVSIIPTIWLDRYQDLHLEFIWPGWERGFIKPQVGANSSGTLRFDASELGAVESVLRDALRRDDMMLQPYLSQVETRGELSAIYIDGVFSHAVRKVPVAGDYRVQDDHGASDYPHTLEAKQLEVCQAVMDAAARVLCLEEPLLYARVDLLHDDKDKLLLTELELVEPSLFFRHGSGAAEKLAMALVARTKAMGQAA